MSLVCDLETEWKEKGDAKDRDCPHHNPSVPSSLGCIPIFQEMSLIHFTHSSPASHS